MLLSGQLGVPDDEQTAIRMPWARSTDHVDVLVKSLFVV